MERRIRTSVVTVIVGLMLNFYTPALHAASMTDLIKEHTLGNGLKIIFIEDHKSPLATFEVWYRVGSGDEAVGKTGLSHFLEHMMFKGTPKYGSKVLSEIIQRNGGINNAHTTKEYTVYWETLSSDRASIAVELEADRMTNLILDPKEAAAELKVVMEERRMRLDDNPQNLLYEQIAALAFSSHPYRWPVIGWMPDIAGLDRDDLYRHYKKYYSPANAFIVIAGDVDAGAMLPQIEKYFGAIPAGEKPEHHRVIEPIQRGEKRICLRKETVKLPYVFAAYHTPSFPDKDCFALEVLSGIMSEGKSSRLYRSLVYKKRIAVSAFADYSGLNIDPFLFVVGAGAAPGKDINEVEKLLYDEIDRIRKTPPSETEVQKAKNQIEASFIFEQDSNSSKAQYAGLFEMLGGWRLMDTYLQGIRSVRPDDVRAVANKYFGADNRTVGILLPERTETR